MLKNLFPIWYNSPETLGKNIIALGNREVVNMHLARKPVILSSTMTCHETDMRSQSASSKSPEDFAKIFFNCDEKNKVTM